MEPVLTTLHGSRLYGLHHANSDNDTYTVYVGASRNFAKQSVNGSEDVTRLGLDSFISQVFRGVPQALEALFSPYAEFHPSYEAFFKSYRVGASEMAMRYRRTVQNFCFEPLVKDEDGNTDESLPRVAHADFKRRRHGFRLALNLSEGLREGRFHPVLTEPQKAFVNANAEVTDDYEERVLQVLGTALLGQLTV